MGYAGQSGRDDLVGMVGRGLSTRDDRYGASGSRAGWTEIRLVKISWLVVQKIGRGRLVMGEVSRSVEIGASQSV